MTVRPLRAAIGLVLAAGLVTTACTGGAEPAKTEPDRPRSRGTAVEPPCPFGDVERARAVGDAGSLPPAFAAVAREVEAVRGHRFREPVAALAVGSRRMTELVERGFRIEFPRAIAERRERAWRVIGALPEDTDLLDSLLQFAGTQVVGFYDPIDDRLVFIGTDAPTPLQRATLAHELTHALDDQVFDLGRLERLNRACEDERAAALTALIEGDAQETTLRWAQRSLTLEELAEVQLEAASFEPPPASVAPFVQGLLLFPYGAGQAFVVRLLARGGQEELDRAFLDPPVSTEQILHPDRYPDDAPQEIVVPDLGPDLGPGWVHLDFQDVGEAWLRLLLDLRASGSEAEAAAAGWDGGQYRAWESGDRVAVVLDSVWDTEGDASEFGAAMERFAGDGPARVIVDGQIVRTLFASDQRSLATLERAAARQPPATGA